MDVIKANWDLPENVNAFTTLSSNPWPIHLKENPDRNNNIIKFASHYNLPKNPFLVRQVHSSNVVNLRDNNRVDIEADAIVTMLDNNPIAILTADCIPILICSDNHIGAVHAGWKGLASGILEKTIEKIGTTEGNIRFWIGPCIRKESFLVRSDFFENLMSIGYKKDYLNTFTHKISDEQWQFDLVALAKDKLRTIGVKSSCIYDSNMCTYKDLRLHSHRRSLGSDRGRIVSVIWTEKS